MGPLGWTHISEGAILPFADIDCDGIRSFLQAGLLGARADTEKSMYGRAVGRVLAHELYHIFANTQHHGAGGVGKATYTVDNLLGGISSSMKRNPRRCSPAKPTNCCRARDRFGKVALQSSSSK